MPITKSAQKALRQSVKRKKENLVYKKKLKDLLKKANACVLEKNKEKAKELLPVIYKTLDKMVKRDILKKNTASRRKSQLSKKLNFSN